MSKKKESLVKEPVRIRTKELANGNQSIYLDCYVNGERKYRFLGIYLRPEKGKEKAVNKEWNKEQMRVAEAVKAQMLIDIQNGEYGFKDYSKAKNINFVDYCESIEKEDIAKGKLSTARMMRTFIRRLVRYKGKVIPLNSIDKEFVMGFLAFLDNENTALNTFLVGDVPHLTLLALQVAVFTKPLEEAVLAYFDAVLVKQLGHFANEDGCFVFVHSLGEVDARLVTFKVGVFTLDKGIFFLNGLFVLAY